MAHRIDGRKLGRKQGPAPGPLQEPTVSVLALRADPDDEAQGKEIRGRVERMITLAKRAISQRAGWSLREFPNEPLVVTKLFDEIAPKYADRTRVSPGSSTSASEYGDAAPIVQIELV